MGSQVFRGITLSGLEAVARNFINVAGHYNVWLFSGEMGSGKTTFIKTLSHVLGVEDAMSSPTFSIINEYIAHDDKKIFHFDFYRIKNEAEAYDIGTEEYFYSGHYCFIEWPEKIPSLIPSRYAEVKIIPENQTYRTLALSVHDGEKENRI
ncbi:MAG: tRNA (adenosine(37)-N6)-threonylcarbamoyltransferase complex ATPase subunit type 1 TsaE [Bacteroidota bacterium]